MQAQTNSLDDKMRAWAMKAVQSRPSAIRSGGEIVEDVTDIPIGDIPESATHRMVVRGRQVVGACCLPDDGGCELRTQSNCEADGGEWKGAGVLCDPNPCGCNCPDGIGETYCVASDALTGSVAIGSTGECQWCGMSADETPKQVSLEIVDDVGDGSCGWKLMIDGATAFKAWEDGDPEGNYTGDFDAAVVACGSTVRPCCDTGVTSINVAATVSGFVTLPGGDCSGEDVDISAARENSSSDPCATGWCTGFAPATYSCPREECEDSGALQVDFCVDLIAPADPDGDWYLRFQALFDVSLSIFCGSSLPSGLGGSITPDINIGPHPEGLYSFSFADDDVPSVNYTFDVTIDP